MIGFFCTVLGAVDGQGHPRQCRETISHTVSLGYGVIVIHTQAELERIIRKLAAKKAAEPYAYDWGSIAYGLYLGDLVNTVPVSRWLD